MLVRSTGLGRTEMEGKFEKVEKKEDYLILNVRTTLPVKWHIRIAVTFSEALKVLALVLSTREGWGFIITQIFRSKRKLIRPQEF